MLLDVSYAANLFFGGREREGLPIFRRASATAIELGDLGLILSANSFTATASFVTGAYADGFASADQAIELAGDSEEAGAGLVLGNPYAQCHWQRAYNAGCLGWADRAWADFDRSLEVAARFRDPECELYALITRGLVRLDVGEVDAGLADAERGVELAERIGNFHAVAAASEVLASARVASADFDGARATAEGALRLVSEHGAGRTYEAALRTSLAIARVSLGDPDGVRAAAEEAVAIADRRSLLREAVRCRVGLARVLAAIAPVDELEIERVLGRALSIAGETGYRASEPIILAALGARSEG